MRVLFLDFDGVLGPGLFEPDIRHGGYGPNWETEQKLHTACQDAMRRVIDTTDCSVVVTSSWRRDDDRSPGEMLGVLQELLVRSGVVGSAEVVVGLTQRLAGRVRGDEIAAWLQDHPEVEAYAIVDDSPDAAATSIESEGRLIMWNDDPDLLERFVQTDHRVGCTEQKADQLISLLGAPPEDCSS